MAKTLARTYHICYGIGMDPLSNLLPPELANLTGGGRGLLAQVSRRRVFDPGAVLYYQGDPSRQLLVVVRGHVRISHIGEDGFVTLFTIIGPRGSFGESGLLDGEPHSDTASTVGTVELLLVEAEAMQGNDEAALDLRLGIGRLLARRFRDHVAFVRGLHFPNLGQRLSHTLLDLFGRLGNDVQFRRGRVRCLGPEVTQRDLGLMARGTRENVNKALRRWEREGILAMEDRHILLLDRERLEAAALSLD